MTPSIKNSSIRVNVKQTTSRQTPKTDFGSVLKQGLNTAADITLQGAAIAAPFVPGGAVVSAAISGVQQMRNVAGGALGSSSGALGAGTSAGSPLAPSVSSSAVSSSGGTLAQTATSSGTSTLEGVDAFKSNLEMSSQMQLQMLGLQMEMQQENRQFTMLSNVMKTKHDTAKAAINNIR